MALAAGGHRRAFEVLAARYLAGLTRYCVKFLGSGRSGEDAAQDALVEAWTRRQRYKAGSFRVYLFTLARHRCLNRLRDERRRAFLLEPGRAPEPTGAATAAPGDQLEELLERERRRRTREALLTIPPKLREALLLRFDQGLSYPEIAGIVGRREVTVRSRVFHGLRKLRTALGEEAVEP